MLETIINTGLIITLFAIAAPFIFVLLVIRMTTGSGSHKKRGRRRERDENEELNEISRGLKDLNRRIENLETLKNWKK